MLLPPVRSSPSLSLRRRAVILVVLLRPLRPLPVASAFGRLLAGRHAPDSRGRDGRVGRKVLLGQLSRLLALLARPLGEGRDGRLLQPGRGEGRVNRVSDCYMGGWGEELCWTTDRLVDAGDRVGCLLGSDHLVRQLRGKEEGQVEVGLTTSVKKGGVSFSI